MEPIFKNRMAKCRAKKKTDALVWEEYLIKDRERNKAKRGIKKVERLSNSKLQIENREKERLRKRAAREKKRQAAELERTPTGNCRLGSYSCPNTLRKAVQKVKRSLPYSPAKKLAVIKEFVKDAEKEGLARQIFPEAQISPTRKLRLITEETTEKVVAFYQSDTVSRQAPGKRDKKSVKNPITGKRDLVQIRHMLVTIKEAYEMFKMENENSVISKSKFYKLRPLHILPVSEMPHNVCVCKYHYNFSSIIDAVGKHFNEESIFPTNYHTLLNKICCDISNENCMTNKCNGCTLDIFDTIPSEVELSPTIKWKEWQEVGDRLTLVENFSSVHNAMAKANSLLANFKTHCFVKNIQHEHFEMLKRNVDDKKLVVQFDFAENYSLVHQDEIQSAHWQHKQVSIFTCVIWRQNAINSYAVVSDDLTHSKYSVWTFVKTIFNDNNNFPGIEQIDVFTDNCAAQFKSRYVISNLCFLEDDLSMKVTWNNFAASHGKGAVDGIGGVIKGKVWVATKSRKYLVNSARDFYECATNECDKINVLYVPKEDVEENKSLLDARFSRACEVPGIQSYHFFQRADKVHVYARKTALSKRVKIRVLKSMPIYDYVYTSSEEDIWPEPLDESIHTPDPSDDDEPTHNGLISGDPDDYIEEGDWVAVIYDDWYPGFVERRDENFLSVNFMNRSATTKFFWPTKPDKQTVEAKDILCKIDLPPFPVSSRHFEMSKKTLCHIQKLYEKFK